MGPVVLGVVVPPVVGTCPLPKPGGLPDLPGLLVFGALCGGWANRFGLNPGGTLGAGGAELCGPVNAVPCHGTAGDVQSPQKPSEATSM